MKIPDHLIYLLQNLYAGQEATVRSDKEQWIGTILGNEYVKAVYFHPAYLTFMQSTLCEMPGWMNHKLESRLLQQISVSSVAHSCPTLCDPIDGNMTGFPVHHQPLELTQIHVHHIGEAIQSSHPPSSPSPPAFNLSWYQGLFQ